MLARDAASPATDSVLDAAEGAAGPCAGPPPIARLAPSQCTYSHFRRHHLLPNRPCIFPSPYTAHWALLRRWVTSTGELDWRYLREQYGDLEVDCAVCTGSEGAEADAEDAEEDVHRFADLLDLWQDGRGRRVYWRDSHLPLAVHRAVVATGGSAREAREKVEKELYEVQACWADDMMNEFEGSEEGKGDDFRFVYAGGGDTLTALHRDVYCSYSISTNLFGRKRWYLFSPQLTPVLRPLIAEAEREGRGVNCDAWDGERKRDFEGKGMVVVEQEAGETIFIPSGWFHSVHNLTHPTISLNHNWANTHCLPAIYASLCVEVARAREAIDDVKDLLREQARRRGQGEEAWQEEWEMAVDALVERSEGWSFPTLFRMILYTLKTLGISRDELEARMENSRWPACPEEARPPLRYVVQQVRPIVADFRRRDEQELRWLPGLASVVDGIDVELDRLGAAGSSAMEGE